MRATLSSLLLARCAFAQVDQSALIDRIRAHMVENLGRQPDYTCLETVERAIRAPKDKDFKLQDVVKLEVALVNGREMFAWPGSSHFEDTDIRHFVPTGMFGNGDFSLYARAVFSKTSTELEYRGEAALDKTPVIRFDFQVPAQQGMRIQSGNTTATIAYHGSIYAGRESLDALRIEVKGDVLPRSLDLSQVSDTLDYARVKIGTSDFLLPLASEAVMTGTRGDESRNRIRFSN